MQRSVLDRIYIAFLLILVVSFVFLIYFISYFTRRSLMQEKQDTLTNEANLIASQAVSSYESGDISKEELTQYLSYYATALNADIWYMSSEGSLIAYSDSAKYFSNASSTDFLVQQPHRFSRKRRSILPDQIDQILFGI